jgi:hypothetical protein
MEYADAGLEPAGKSQEAGASVGKDGNPEVASSGGAMHSDLPLIRDRIRLADL